MPGTVAGMDFHDATLLSVHVDWVHGTAVVLLRVASKVDPVETLAVGVTEVRVPRQQLRVPASRSTHCALAPTN